ncbi:uncharacterized protein F4807DRAFT_466640 [Annulohypoxylon truncatum]|uniref:uncharacterized protein n=1 Tax=Annulohypoxylon truncatum TaxID=327061 RepID=UPI0020089618|nr:uncharacterized protein F4807DRAFT_466640 [Annulohypoxylon truncatum]KAI1211371.1 hypothetical protein F4807DRAFT_466640 [Annulohypoxylon truncatum]
MQTRSQSNMGSSTSGLSSSRTPSSTPSPASAAARKAVQRTPSKPKAKLLGNPKITKPALFSRNSSGSSGTSSCRVSVNNIRESIEVKQSAQGEDKPEPMDETLSKLPSIWKIYKDGPPGRLFSIEDIKNHVTIYHHERDANKPLELTFNDGKVVYIKNLKTGKVIYSSPSCKF